MAILIRDLANIYNGVSLKPLKVQYKDYAKWQQERLNSEKLKSQKEYWMRKFHGNIPILSLQTDYPRKQINKYDGDILRFDCDKKLQNQLKDICKYTESTMYMILLSAFYILLFNYTRQEDIIVGTSISGRTNPDLYDVIGIFINTLAIRSNPNEHKSFVDFLQEVRENCLKAYENQEYPFVELISELRIKRDVSRNPLFDVMFELINDESKNISFKDFKLTEYNAQGKTSKFDLSLSVKDDEKGLSIILEYNTGIFLKKTMENFTINYTRILKAISMDINIKIGDICGSNLIKTQEKKKISDLFNNL